jgi:hypothetical protein
MAPRKMSISKTILCVNCLFIFLLPLVFFLATGCQQQEDNKKAAFSAEITGAFEGGVKGPGIIQYSQPSKTSTGDIPGHYLIADDTGFRDLGVTITLPISAQPGKHDLVSAQPLDVGKYYEVCVDRAIGHKVISYSQNTKGSLTLISFAKAPEVIAGSEISGSFEVSTENSEGKRVKVVGRFLFKGK